ncbi:MAG: hypothetical protein GXY33_19590 [Phycisphaerae bacterium]|nr:hypothetical protein [Phycisphaerae bacterium]
MRGVRGIIRWLGGGLLLALLTLGGCASYSGYSRGFDYDADSWNSNGMIDRNGDLGARAKIY